MNIDKRNLQEVDIDVFNAIEKEKKRQDEHIELIASENFVSNAVLEAMGSCFTNKYAEGYPNARYYNGCENIDEVETLAIERAKKLFGAEHANVQPHSGSNANLAVFLACLNAGETFMGMSLTAGGHLSHGAPFNISGKFFKSILPFLVIGNSSKNAMCDGTIYLGNVLLKMLLISSSEIFLSETM